MYKLGIIGTENSHAMAFTRIINLPDPITGKRLYPDVKVVGVYGPDVSTAQPIVDEAGAEFVAASPEEFHGRVDAMLITNRAGSLHKQYAMPFIEKGLPVFIDKPFTSNLGEALEIVEAAKKSGSNLLGGSSCKLSYDIALLQNSVKNNIAAGSMVSGSLSFAADPESEYDGVYFYSPHLVEMALTVFGSDVRQVFATENNGSRISIWRYDGFDVSLHFTKGVPGAVGVVYSKNGIVTRNIDISMVYGQEVDQFIQMVKTGVMPVSYESLVQPVRMIAAIEEAVKTGTVVKM